MNSHYIFFDIDCTLTGYRKNALAPENLLHGNFLFPILRDLMEEKGWEKAAAEAAILQLTQTVPFWDYPDFIAEFDLPGEEAFKRFRNWHTENLFVYDDAISLVKELYAQNKKLFVISNNPYSGCCLKLERAGLGNEFGSPYFQHIFGTNQLRGCKFVPGVWKRALAYLPASPAEIGMVGDNPVEDGEIPRSLGVGEIHLLERVKDNTPTQAAK